MRSRCFDVFRVPQPRRVGFGQIERADPERTSDGAHEHRAIARKLGQPARVERPLRVRLVAAGQFLRSDSETPLARPIVRFSVAVGCPPPPESRPRHALPETRARMQNPNAKFKKPEVRRSAYSGSATKPALVSVIGLFAEASISGARPKAARASLMVKMPFDV